MDRYLIIGISCTELYAVGADVCLTKFLSISCIYTLIQTLYDEVVIVQVDSDNNWWSYIVDGDNIWCSCIVDRDNIWWSYIVNGDNIWWEVIIMLMGTIFDELNCWWGQYLMGSYYNVDGDNIWWIKLLMGTIFDEATRNRRGGGPWQERWGSLAGEVGVLGRRGGRWGSLAGEVGGGGPWQERWGSLAGEVGVLGRRGGGPWQETDKMRFPLIQHGCVNTYCNCKLCALQWNFALKKLCCIFRVVLFPI